MVSHFIHQVILQALNQQQATLHVVSQVQYQVGVLLLKQVDYLMVLLVRNQANLYRCTPSLVPSSIPPASPTTTSPSDSPRVDAATSDVPSDEPN